MALDQITLVANPGSASRKYALFKGKQKLVDIHFEIVNGVTVYSTSHSNKSTKTKLAHLAFAATMLPEVVSQETDSSVLNALQTIALRVVAPSTFFQRDHALDSNVIKRLERLKPIAPLHIGATLSEYQLLRKTFPKHKFVGISDSGFLSNKPEKAMLYGIPYKDANQLDIKRFGYHGLSLESVVSQLKTNDSLATRTVICHLGGGCGVAAVKAGTVVDSTMGFSPLEGVVMATRSGSIDLLAYETVKKAKRLNAHSLHDYFNSSSGLYGVSGVSSDIRELLEKESNNKRARLALDMFVYNIQKAIGAMTSVLGGVDVLVYTGTIGERSFEMRRRISGNLMHLGFVLDAKKNHAVTSVSKPTVVTKSGHPGKITVVHSDENSQIVKHALRI